MEKLTIRNLYKSYGDLHVLEDLNADIPAGGLTILTGPSGSGKTTLLRILAGLEKADAGRIDGFSVQAVRMVFQEDRLLEYLDAVTNVRLACPKTPLEEILQAFRELGIRETEGKPVLEFSGGMKRRTALIRGVLSPSRIVLLDEPFKGLDPHRKQEAVAFTERKTRGKTVILATHEPEETGMAEKAWTDAGRSEIYRITL